MFKRIIFWSEFPERVEWKKVIKLIDFKSEIYIAVKNKKEFLKYKKKIVSKYISIGAWLILPKKEGYWFSGFTSIKNIDKLKQFKGMKIKIDLEPPIPPFGYNNVKCAIWLIKMFFKKAENKDYLKSVIYWLANNNTRIIINKFPLPNFYLEKASINIECKKNMVINLMTYTSPVGKFFISFIRFYNKLFLKNAFKKNKKISASVGLIGPGILKTEEYYKKTNDFLKDLDMIKSIGLENIAVYSIDSIMQRKNPKEWVDVLKELTS